MPAAVLATLLFACQADIPPLIKDLEAARGELRVERLTVHRERGLLLDMRHADGHRYVVSVQPGPAVCALAVAKMDGWE